MGLNHIPWKETALMMMPNHAETISKVLTPYELWSELWCVFESAYDEPRDSSVIEQIYAFAVWCDDQPRGETAAEDLLTCVAVCFYEDIPAFEPAREDIPNWFTREEFDRMHDLFKYRLTEHEFEKIEKSFSGRIFRQVSRISLG